MMFVVTGGAGFIGSVIIAKLQQAGLMPISVIDDLGSGEKWRNIAKRHLHDIVPIDRGLSFLAGLKDATIIHMGARTSTTDNDTEALAETNVRLTSSLFELCAARRWPFVWASSAAIYGTKADAPTGVDLGALRPLNPYAWSKLAAEKAISERVRSGFEPPMWVGLRLFNIYGPNEEHKGDQMSFVSKCFEAIRMGEPIKLFRGSDRFMRDWVYVDDVGDLVIAMLGDPAMRIKSGVYDVGTGSAVSFSDVAATCIDAANKAVGLEWIQFPEALYGRYQAMTRANTASLETALPGLSGLQAGAVRYWKDYASKEGLARHP
jgi:ADP-L-glycero-D-manno-heptose 6-epimerase